MSFSALDHTFVICAYKESDYLEECIQSLLTQSVKTKIIMATSTPNDYIRTISLKYDIPLFINEGEKGIGGDWNFAYSMTKTSLVTIAHQDDVYKPKYTEEMLKCINSSKNPIIYFCGYAELRNGKEIFDNKLLSIKRLLLLPLKVKSLWKSRFVRRRILSFGCPICCPSVTYVKDIVGSRPFKNDYLSDLDWQQWEILSQKKGSFVYNSTPLMCHRIHEESATTEIIGDSVRSKEDYEMFLKFWPKFIAKIIVKMYKKSEKSNEV